VHGKSKLTDTEKARQVKSKVKSMLIILFDIKGIAKQLIPHTAVMSYADRVKTLTLITSPYHYQKPYLIPDKGLIKAAWYVLSRCVSILHK
jgi:hypothetical protein